MWQQPTAKRPCGDTTEEVCCEKKSLIYWRISFFFFFFLWWNQHCFSPFQVVILSVAKLKNNFHMPPSFTWGQILAVCWVCCCLCVRSPWDWLAASLTGFSSESGLWPWLCNWHDCVQIVIQHNYLFFLLPPSLLSTGGREKKREEKRRSLLLCFPPELSGNSAALCTCI